MTSRAWYGVAAIVLLAGLGAAGWTAWQGLAGLAGSFKHMMAPGSAMLELEEIGTYTIFHESPGIVDGRTVISNDISGLSVKISGPDGAAIRVHAPSGKATYDYGGREGMSFQSFEIAVPGRYRISAAYPDGKDRDQAVLTVERGFTLRLLITIVKTAAFGICGVIGALVIFLAAFIRRARQRRRLAAAR